MEEGEARRASPIKEASFVNRDYAKTSVRLQRSLRRQAERFPTEGLLALGQELRRGINWCSSCLVQFLFRFVFLHLFVATRLFAAYALLRLANHTRLYASGMPIQKR